MKKTISVFMAIALAFTTSILAFATDYDYSILSSENVLQSTGMPQSKIRQLDENVIDFIANDLKKSGKVEEFRYFSTEELSMPITRVNQVLEGISFTVTAFKSNSEVYVYPTYEFTTDKKPVGHDSFSFQFGDALRPYEYGGQAWYKDYTMTSWEKGGSLTANVQSLNGAEYSGAQLGTPDYSMKIRGCAYAHCQIGSGTDKRIVMMYMYNPNRDNYSISFSYSGVGISYSSTGSIYTASKTEILNY